MVTLITIITLITLIVIIDNIRLGIESELLEVEFELIKGVSNV